MNSSQLILILLILQLVKYSHSAKESRAGCITSGRTCDHDSQCCGENNCYKRASLEPKRCIPCKEEGNQCKADRNCCSDRCINGRCVPNSIESCEDCNIAEFEALDDSSIRDAVDLWFEDRNLAERKYGLIGCWDVRRVTSFQLLFSFREGFNQNLNCWDTSNVETMSGMFQYATDFNGDISDWDLGRVTRTEFMFFETEFNIDISDWDTSSVEDMFQMFFGNKNFNQEISDWDVDSVTDMGSMFFGAKSFDQKLCWDVADKYTTDMLSFSDGCIDPMCCMNCNESLLC